MSPSPASELKLVSYNCRGWRSGSDYVKFLLQSCDLRFIQEHWLYRDHLEALNISEDFLSVGVSGIDSSEILLDRPFGWSGILYHKSPSSFVRRIFTSSQSIYVLSHSLLSTLVITPPLSFCLFVSPH